MDASGGTGLCEARLLSRGTEGQAKEMTFRKSSQALLIFWVSALALCAASSHSSIWNLRLRGGHRQGCTCGDRGDESEQGLFDAIRLDACCSMNTDSGYGE